MPGRVFIPGASDLESRIAVLADKLSEGLRPLAPVAYNYSWSWDRDGAAVFRDINPHRWALSGENPVRFLNDLWPSTQEAAERNPRAARARRRRSQAEVDAMLARPACRRPGVDGPVVFMCAEFGFHASMPIYSGGLGVLAGDILKEASDQALEMIGIGLLYRRGYFRQRLDISGRQQEYWLELDPKSLPMARVTAAGRHAVCCSRSSSAGRRSPSRSGASTSGACRCSSSTRRCPRTTPSQRWTTARLYEGNRAVRLAQYGLLGIGGARVLEALGIEPAVIHLNEGHPALAALELAAHEIARGVPPEEALRPGRAAVRLHHAHAGRRRQRDLPARRSSWPPTPISAIGSTSTRRTSSASAACPGVTASRA